MSWVYGPIADSDNVFVIPANDLIWHLHEDCPCGVTFEPIKRDDGSVAWMHVHHSLDGRELHES